MNDQRRREHLMAAGQRKVRACLGKTKFPSKKNASGRALTLVDITMQAYKCPLCHGWHIGHSRIRVRG